MSTSHKFTLARFLEELFIWEENSQLKAIAAALVLCLWFWFLSLDKLPSKAETLAAARQSAGRGVVVRASQNARGNFELDVMDRDNRLIQQAFWYSYYPSGVAVDTANRLSYRDWQRLSLAAYARVGDSLWKKPNSLNVQVKRGATTRTFYYRNPYQ
jgi:alkanesulfonate monooxygenase SsuD/methylene tetrahydromethanopterin reductase-like flavin-dependent oxidoreductase (luciferase family)